MVSGTGRLDFLNDGAHNDEAEVSIFAWGISNAAHVHIQNKTVLVGINVAAACVEHARRPQPKEKRPDVVACDYLQLFQDYPRKSMAERADLVSGVMMRIRNELDIGVLVSFQLGKDGKRMYGGTAVYRDANVILHLEQKKDEVTNLEMDKIVTVTVMPSRDVGESKFEVTASGTHSRVSEVGVKAPDFLTNPNVTEREPIHEYQPAYEPVGVVRDMERVLHLEENVRYVLQQLKGESVEKPTAN